jgi:hypothetical protein
MEPKNNKPGLAPKVFMGGILLVIGLTCLAMSAFIVIHFKGVTPIFLIFWGGICVFLGALFLFAGKKA